MAICTENEQFNRAALKDTKRIVIKAGTHVLVDKNGTPNLARIQALVSQIATLKKSGREVILVSSGAIGTGVHVMGMKTRPTDLPSLQMAAAVGQTELLALYKRLFAEHGFIVSQLLLTHADLRDRQRHLNARNTLLTSLHHGVVPIINENDTVAVDEIKIGDNDVLSSLITVLVDADALILLTTPNGLQQHMDDRVDARISYLSAVNEEALALAVGKTSALSTGGMATKLQAAQNAATIGALVVIASGFQEHVIEDVMAGHSVGTLIGDRSQPRTINKKRKSWISFFHKSQGILRLDTGAVAAVQTQGKSLLPSGIKVVEGEFGIGAMVTLQDENGAMIGSGLVEYDSVDIEKIKGCHSSKIAAILGENGATEVIHRDNLVIN